MVTLEHSLAYAREMRANAAQAIEAANAQRERARELGGGLLSFGGSGSQRARKAVQSAADRGLRMLADAEAAYERWDAKVLRLERQIVERDRRRFTRDELVGATHIRTDVGWHEVVRVNQKSVSVESGFSWVDRYAFEKVLEVRS